MIRVAAFDPRDLQAMTVQEAQPELIDAPVYHARQLAATGRCFTARDRHGAVLFCGGALETHPRYATMWAALSPHAGSAMLALTRRVRWFAASLPHERVDALVRASHRAAHRWMAMLGFVREAELGVYFADGEDAVIYRLVRGDTR
jgi:hypothetical protein